MENPLPAYPSRPPLPAIEITDTESTAPERLGAQSSGIRVANSSPRNSRSSFYFTPNDSESNLSTSTTGRPGEEGSDEDECIVRRCVSLVLTFLTVPRTNFSLMTLVGRCSTNPQTLRFVFAARCPMLQSEPHVHLLR